MGNVRRARAAREAGDAAELVAFLADADVPALISVASVLSAAVTDPLAAAGFAPAPVREPLMWCPTPAPT